MILPSSHSAPAFSPARPVRVALAGVHGFGRNHLRSLRELTAAGAAELVGVCDVTPVPETALGGLGTPAFSSDLAALVRETDAEVAIVATPIHTHAPLAEAALRAGAHVLLEKPPTPSLAEFDRLCATVDRSGHACQVGFQFQGSAALPALRQLLAGGEIGTVRGIGVAGAWSRDTAYYARARWAGRRRLDGVDVVDGALTNPFAHAVAAALAVDGGQITALETELYRAFPIEADDTSCLRVHTVGGLTGGRPITVAVTLAAPEQEDPVLTVHGERGRAVLWYTRDRVRVERDGAPGRTVTHERTRLLDDLLAHVAHPGPGPRPRLLSPLAASRPFMQVLEAVRTAPDPAPLPAEEWPADGTPGAVRRVVPGITEVVTASAARLALFSELPQFSGLTGRHA